MSSSNSGQAEDITTFAEQQDRLFDIVKKTKVQDPDHMPSLSKWMTGLAQLERSAVATVGSRPVYSNVCHTMLAASVMILADDDMPSLQKLAVIQEVCGVCTHVLQKAEKKNQEKE